MGTHIRIRISLVLKEFVFDLGRKAHVEVTFLAETGQCQGAQGKCPGFDDQGRGSWKECTEWECEGGQDLDLE